MELQKAYRTQSCPTFKPVPYTLPTVQGLAAGSGRLTVTPVRYAWHRTGCATAASHARTPHRNVGRLYHQRPPTRAAGPHFLATFSNAIVPAVTTSRLSRLRGRGPGSSMPSH